MSKHLPLDAVYVELLSSLTQLYSSLPSATHKLDSKLISSGFLGFLLMLSSQYQYVTHSSLLVIYSHYHQWTAVVECGCPEPVTKLCVERCCISRSTVFVFLSWIKHYGTAWTVITLLTQIKQYEFLGQCGSLCSSVFFNVFNNFCHNLQINLCAADAAVGEPNSHRLDFLLYFTINR